MERKKSPKADLENKRKIFVEIGLVIALAVCLFSFESGRKNDQAISLGELKTPILAEDIVPITRPEEAKPELPPPPKVVDLIKIVDNNTEIVDELKIEDSEADRNTAINAAMHLAETPKEIEEEDAPIFIVVEEMPEFPGGDKALLNFLNQNVKYPSTAIEYGISGRVTVSFVVNKDGSITGAKILRGIDPSLDLEALRVVNSLPKWKPGKQGGKPVRVSYSVPINFVLQH